MNNEALTDICRSKLVLEMASVLLARQWRLVATAFLPCGGNRSETMFFCKDSRRGKHLIYFRMKQT